MKVNTLAKTLADGEVNTLEDTLDDVHCEALVDTSPECLAWVETNPQRDPLGHVRAKVLINSLAVALEQARPRILAAHWVMWRSGQTLGESLRDVEAGSLPTRWLSRYKRRKPRHFGHTLRDVKSEALLDIFADNLAQLVVKTLATT